MKAPYLFASVVLLIASHTAHALPIKNAVIDTFVRAGQLHAARTSSQKSSLLRYARSNLIRISKNMEDLTQQYLAAQTAKNTHPDTIENLKKQITEEYHQSQQFKAIADQEQIRLNPHTPDNK